MVFELVPGFILSSWRESKFLEFLCSKTFPKVAHVAKFWAKIDFLGSIRPLFEDNLPKYRQKCPSWVPFGCILGEIYF